MKNKKVKKCVVSGDQQFFILTFIIIIKIYKLTKN